MDRFSTQVLHPTLAPLVSPLPGGAFFCRPTALRGSHCAAAAFEALSCGRDRVRWRSRWLLLRAPPAVEPVAPGYGSSLAAGSLVLRSGARTRVEARQGLGSPGNVLTTFTAYTSPH